MKCVNEKCNNDIDKFLTAVLVTTDGDFTCCDSCKNEYEKQRDIFFENIGNDEFYKNWLGLETIE